MVKIKREKASHILYLITGLISGIIIGSLSLLLMVSYRLEEYHKEIVSLENKIEESRAKLEKLEEAGEKPYLSLQDIKVHLDFQGDEIAKIHIEKAIKEKYISLLGKDVKDMDGNILAEVIDRRIFKLDEREYKLTAEKVILSEVLKLYIRVEENE